MASRDHAPTTGDAQQRPDEAAKHAHYRAVLGHIRLAKSLMPLRIFTECSAESEVVMVSSLALPQHPICLTGPNKEYAEMIMFAVNLLARVPS